MKAVYYPAFKELTIAELPIPECGADEVLIKVSACGVCGSELESFKNMSPRRQPPLIMGHEFSGVIEAVGTNVKGWAKGDTVVSNSVVSCGSCYLCKEGKGNLCADRQVFGMHRNGAFAEYINVPAAALIAMPAHVDPRHASLSEPLANGVHIAKLTQHLPIKNVLIIGAGPIGLAVQQAFKALRNARTIVSDIVPERIQAAKQIGASGVINPATEDLRTAINTITNGEPVDLVIDAVGSEQTNKTGLDIVKPGGTFVIIGLHNNSKSLLSYDIILTEKTVMGTYAATQEDMQDALTLIADGKVDVSSWVHYYPLDKGVEAFKDMLEPKGNHIKSVIVF